MAERSKMKERCEVPNLVKGSVTRIMAFPLARIVPILFCDPHCSIIERAVPFDFNESNSRFWPQFVMGQTS